MTTTTTELLLTAWDSDPVVIAILIVVVLAYALLSRGQAPARSAYFGGAIVLLVLSLASPIAVLARDYLFSAHMLQHLLLVLVVPPLALLSLPVTEGRAGSSGAVARVAVPQWGLGVGAMWLWHAPTLCNAASRSLAVHSFQTLSLLAMGTAFWWPVFGPRAQRRLAPLGAMVYLFTACIACTVLGVFVTFSPVAVCSVYVHPVDRLGALSLLRDGWGLTPKVDQEIGGLMMWVPACIVYVVTILAMLRRYYREDALAITAADPMPRLAKEEA